MNLRKRDIFVVAFAVLLLVLALWLIVQLVAGGAVW